MELKRVRAVEQRFRNKMGEIEEINHQYLEVLHEETIKFLWWTFKKKHWIKIDEEIVPSAIVMEHNCLGWTAWKSKWNGMPNVKWIKLQ